MSMGLGRDRVARALAVGRRRQPHRSRGNARALLLAFVAVALLALAVLSLLRRDSATHVHAIPSAHPTRRAAAHPSPSPTETVRREPAWEKTTAYVYVWPPPAPEPSATVTPAFDEEPTPPPARAAAPTPAPADCVTFTFAASPSPVSLAHVLVEIRARNRCGRDLAPLELWFEAAGFRHGDLVQSVRGHPFETLGRDDEQRVLLALPGSLDWYDEVRVRTVTPGPP
jgi:hypothetical protein